jgi:rubredoxin
MKMTIEFETIECCSCGFVFAIPKGVKKKWEETNRTFHCPSCDQSQHYCQESDADKYKRLYKQKIACCDELQETVKHQEKRIYGYMGALAKSKKITKP